jgi:hypothetical protein
VRGARGSHPHITTLTRAGGKVRYQVIPKVFWPDGTVHHRYGGLFDTLEEAELVRDRVLAELQAERDAERKRGADATDANDEVEPTSAPKIVLAPHVSAWDAFQQVQSVILQAQSHEAEVVTTIEGDKPIMVVYLTDLHVGHMWCLMDLLRRHLRIIEQMGGAIRVIFGGDLFSMALPGSPQSPWEELCRPAMQRQLIDEVIDPIAPHILSIRYGNHDSRSVKNADFDAIGYLASRLRVPYLGAFGMDRVRLGSQERPHVPNALQLQQDASGETLYGLRERGRRRVHWAHARLGGRGDRGPWARAVLRAGRLVSGDRRLRSDARIHAGVGPDAGRYHLPRP